MNRYGTLLRFIMAVAKAAHVDPKLVAKYMGKNHTDSYAAQLYNELDKQSQN